MKNAIILHGKPGKDEYYSASLPSASNSHWLPWLQKELLIRDVAAHTPEIPNAWLPEYSTWCHEFERYEITPETLLVGHSCGGGFLVRWLSEHPEVRVGKVVLVAPSLGLDWDSRDFFAFTMDPTAASRTKGMVIFVGGKDRPAIHESAGTIRSTITGVSYREFPQYGHFCLKDMQTDTFPELRDELLA
ncbi:MAG TPA: alpha/beta hydrolase [Candidatus Saccharimonadales bacterium]|nr:alpha/beta hydrolase [Candidatus Saccharimonadales bacterium]